jgi:hypothetical protein
MLILEQHRCINVSAINHIVNEPFFVCRNRGRVERVVS